MDELLSKQLPMSTEAEQSVIGSMLVNPNCISEVIELLPVQIVPSGGHHGWLAGAQAREKAHAQPDDCQDRQITPHALADFPQAGAEQRLYHSISSTGTGRSLTSTDVTVPFFTWITRSAMAVRALLWVMMMTVMPCFRLMIWSSFRIDLPVL